MTIFCFSFLQIGITHRKVDVFISFGGIQLQRFAVLIYCVLQGTAIAVELPVARQPPHNKSRRPTGIATLMGNYRTGLFTRPQGAFGSTCGAGTETPTPGRDSLARDTPQPGMQLIRPVFLRRAIDDSKDQSLIPEARGLFD
jgi:hypothetical protein